MSPTDPPYSAEQKTTMVRDDTTAVSSNPDWDSPEPKRRKVRKGTRSCWQCKRRKIKCNFRSESDAVCVGCRQRGTNCVSQEYDEYEISTVSKGGDVGQRLERMEAMMEMFASRIFSPREAGSRDVGQLSLVTPPSQHTTPIRQDSPSSADIIVTTESLRRPSSPSGLHSLPVAPESNKHEQLSSILFASIPSKDDVEIMVTSAQERPCHLVMWLPYDQVFNHDLSWIKGSADYPSPDTHPTLIGLRMLSWAIFLQHMHPFYNPALTNLSQDWHVLKDRLSSLAITHVSSNDELVGTLEGLQCVLLEALFHINNRNLRRAWIVFRRAFTICQTLGIHKDQQTPVKKLDPVNMASTKHIWLRVLYYNCHLSLILDLPFAGLGTNMNLGEAISSENPVDKLERSHVTIAKKLLEQNEWRGSDVQASWDLVWQIDLELQATAKSIPSWWWPMPEMPIGNVDRLFKDTARILSHIFHYNLLIQLHLPFVLRSCPQDPKFEYSRNTCVNASRELLIRFISFRSVNVVAFSCRGVDYLAFTASMMLLLAHLEAHKHNSGIFLGHQRSSDRGMVEKVIECLEEVHRQNHDSMSTQSAQVLRQLLDKESDGTDARSGTQEAANKTADIVFSMPHYGTIRISADGVSRGFPMSVGEAMGQPLPDTSGQSGLDINPTELAGLLSGSFENTGQGMFEGVDVAFFDNLLRGVDFSAMDNVNSGGLGRLDVTNGEPNQSHSI
ncbi:uncharacterized protein B0J16DRAFT_343158 [Fusarium flagelliforme]|uniref:uncharacterized protein n=1 Tax=Fusarium flagelliforme TaxID=2675880 RepID=UPI001E8DF726|nr:uncharacterized protein B0J16DRAFT_343158 [Fusarium flagelliforme]KAH7186053.1 hypothetical protein B0J16DRAFT_343158 [Fusarium flagelliforme]